MSEAGGTMAEQVARAVQAFALQALGHAPESVAVALSEDVLVVTLRKALSPAEEAAARAPEGAARVREFHRQLFASASGPLRQEIRRITGVAVREASAEVEPAGGAVVQVFPTGAVVQVFRLARHVPVEFWTDGRPAGQS